MTIPIQFFAKPILFRGGSGEKSPVRDRRAGLPYARQRERIQKSVGRGTVRSRFSTTVCIARRSGCSRDEKVS